MDLTRKNENPLNPGIPGEGWCCVRYLYYSSIKTSQSFRSDLCKTALSNLLGVSPAASYPLFCANDPRKFLRWKEAWKLQIFDDPLGALITGGDAVTSHTTLRAKYTVTSLKSYASIYPPILSSWWVLSCFSSWRCCTPCFIIGQRIRQHRKHSLSNSFLRHCYEIQAGISLTSCRKRLNRKKSCLSQVSGRIFWRKGTQWNWRNRKGT